MNKINRCKTIKDEIKRALIKLFPESALKNKLMCFYWNKFRNNDFKISYSKGSFKVNKNGHLMKFKENPYPEFAEAIKNYFKHYKPNKGDFIVDGGAYIGAFAVYCAKVLGENGKVIAFEPDDNNFIRLLENIRINNVGGRIIPIKRGLWNLKARLALGQEGSRGAKLIFDKEITRSQKLIKVNSLDQELYGLKIKKVDFIKFDIEGAEIEALEGSKITLIKNKCLIAIASYHIRNGNQTYKKCEEGLRNIGLKTETVIGGHATTHGFWR